LAEIIKHGVIADADLFFMVENRLDDLLNIDEPVYQEIIPWNCRIKARVIETDEKEQGLRAILNFGHTIGHAVETLTEYKQFLHGEAVAMGMWVEAELGCRLGITPRGAVEAIASILQKAGFPLQKPNLDADRLLQVMFHDKKVEQKTLRFIFPTQIGNVVIQPVREEHLIKEIWNTIRFETGCRLPKKS
jgi:3-dehydroquinate synthetase